MCARAPGLRGKDGAVLQAELNQLFQCCEELSQTLTDIELGQESKAKVCVMCSHVQPLDIAVRYTEQPLEVSSWVRTCTMWLMMTR